MKESKAKTILRKFLFPLVLLKRKCVNKRIQYLGKTDLKKLAAYQYKMRLGKRIDWENPKDLNEKIQWLKFYSDTTEWTRCADKYRIREFVKERGLENLLVKLYGKWEKAEDIEWESLPEQFVLKVNNGSGDVLICTDKEKLNIEETTHRYSELLKLKFWRLYAEPHYENIKPCIIAEELLDKTQQCIQTETLIDYKIWCFNGEPFCVWCCYNRTPKTVEVGTYDLDWNYHEEKSVFTDHYIKAQKLLPRPQSLEQMLEYAKILSKGFPEVRVDFYEVGGKPYLGEMTFTSKGGYMDFYTKEFLMELGDKVILPSNKNR